MTSKFYLVTGEAGLKGGVLAKRLLNEGNRGRLNIYR